MIGDQQRKVMSEQEEKGQTSRAVLSTVLVARDSILVTTCHTRSSYAFTPSTTTTMEPSYRIVPGNQTKSASIQGTANSLGLHDTLRHGPRSLAAEVQTEGGLKGRLENWEATQDNAKLTLRRNIYGMHAPMRLLMERKIVSQTSPFVSAMSPSNLHLDILMGRDETIEPADIFLGMENGPSLDIHEQLRK
ncbi:hypothetical protein D9615_006399 [Tricholomella constricta]|uniref:Proteasome maturation factor UMP1 n=1 Tax=Tricholomella constricta TaxID=117010 RepID=A0A8H5H5W9_9AGAR|nr:hypothetical protein D9615_006399 [Tricholomella constricta]